MTDQDSNNARRCEPSKISGPACARFRGRFGPKFLECRPRGCFNVRPNISDFENGSRTLRHLYKCEGGRCKIMTAIWTAGPHPTTGGMKRAFE